MNTMRVMEIQLMLVRQQTIITVKLRKALVFVLIITFLSQQNDLYLYLSRKFQKNKTDHTTLDFMLLSQPEAFTILNIHQSKVVKLQRQESTLCN